MNIKDLVLDKGYWYLATPYTKYEEGLEAAYIEASTAAGVLLKQGVHTFCPIAHSHPIAAYGDIEPTSHKIFMPLDHQFMTPAHGLIVVMMPGYEKSKGIRIEYDTFNEQGKPIYFLSWPELEIVDAVY